MTFLFKEESIDYSIIGNGHNHILFLHGWGGNKNSFLPTINILKSSYKLITITLPTILPTHQIWTLDDYVELVRNILLLNNITSLSIICHSFGFRVASKLKDYLDIKKVVVTGGAGPKKINFLVKIKNQNNTILLKQKKFSYLYKKLASEDYKDLSNTNKKTFKNIVNLNTRNLIKFNCPILIFWGKKDTATKLWIAKLIKKKNNAKLITTASDHFAYIKLNSLFNNYTIKFLGEV